MTRKHTIITTVAVAAVAISLCASAASADLLDYMDYRGMGRKKTVRLHYAGDAGSDINMRVQVGEMNLRIDDEDSIGYCVDIFQTAGDTYVSQVNPLDTSRGYLAAYLYDTYAGAVSSNQDAAALGVSIWEVMFETGTDFDVTTGDLWITDNSGVVAAAGALLTGLPDSYTPDPQTRILFSETKQDMITTGVTPVPEPATMGLLAIGGVLALIRHKRRTA